MSDIVERLREWSECGPNDLLESASADLFVAADEIDRLRAENERLTADLSLALCRTCKRSLQVAASRWENRDE